jgi:phosphopantothenoylcysteine decarboxylase/phosphopantothenate--cysteine ligase
MRIVLGVTGGIAAFRACDVVSQLRKAGHEVRVVMTEGARRFVTPLTFEALSGNPVAQEMWESSSDARIEHISLAQWPDVLAVAPATANVIGKIANGIADDMLTTVVMATLPETPIVIAPAMNTKMWQNPIMQRNVAYLKSLGRYHFVDPRVSLLACGDYGEGALALPEAIVTGILAALPSSPIESTKDTKGHEEGAERGSEGARERESERRNETDDAGLSNAASFAHEP